MPPSFKDEIANALRGLGLLLRGNAAALLHYDLSEAGFWRSFRAPLITGAIYVLLMMPEGRTGEADLAWPLFILLQAVQYLLAWGIYLGLIAGLSRMFGLSGRYAVFVVLYNWAQAIVTAASIPILAGGALQLIPGSVLVGWSAALLLAWFYIVVQAARHGLQATLPVALAAAIFDLTVSLVLYRLGDLLV